MFRPIRIIGTLAIVSLPLYAQLYSKPVYALTVKQQDAQHHLTLYQSDLGLVNSRFDTPPMASSISIKGLPNDLIAASVTLSGASIARQQWHNTTNSSANSSPHFEQRLSAMIGQTISLEHIETAQRLTGKLLGFNGTHIEFESGDGSESSVIRYPLSGNWQPRIPSYEPQGTELELELDDASNLTQLDLGYLTRGLSWQTEYQIELIGESRIDLNARAALHNRTDANFAGATLDLLAGNPRMPQKGQPMIEMRAMAGVALMADAAPASEVQGYQLFNLTGEFDLAPNSSQRVPLLSAKGLSASVSYQMSHNAFAGQGSGIEQAYADQRIGFKLDESIINKPLPSGEVSLYKRDSNSRLQFVGSERLAQYSPGQTVELNYGQVFDLRSERRQTDYQRNGNAFIQGYEVELINGAGQARVIEYKVNLSQQWSLVDASQLATVDGMQARWLVEVPANASHRLSYTLRLTR